jgi:hypothetical protein
LRNTKNQDIKGPRIKVKPYEERAEEPKEVETAGETVEEGPRINEEVKDEYLLMLMNELLLVTGTALRGKPREHYSESYLSVMYPPSHFSYEAKEEFLDNYEVKEGRTGFDLCSSWTEEKFVEFLKKYSPCKELIKELSYEEVMELKEVRECYEALSLQGLRSSLTLSPASLAAIAFSRNLIPSSSPPLSLRALPLTFKGDDRIVAACVIENFEKEAAKRGWRYGVILSLRLLEKVHQRLGVSFRYVFEIAKKVKEHVERYERI